MLTTISKTLFIGVLASLLFSFTAAAQDKVYKKVLEDGTVVYTDEKQEGAEEVEVETVVSEFEPVESAVLKQPDEEAQDEQVAASVSIVAPAHEQTIRSNQGIVDVIWAPQTRNVEGELSYELLVDGNIAYQGDANGATLEGLNRGEHRLRVRMYDEAGEELAVSDTVVIYMHQATIYNPALNPNVNNGGTGGQN
ncbi:DUF4124 domain-containing protein [Pseudidiomarina insulisalsae]|uniref:DUF4124 domain-containing protein n=1 Tax=Pseudidiomarina insulisalsae TaxID=575789 RepID=A0A432YQR7_9GAMM|nr:DUF4124 domain-containing protein [Pseudidiomarina insulisalsae]RUO63690.1 hypothetical protein CWI71_01100 [Pseudidiomarina insulisalsae]